MEIFNNEEMTVTAEQTPFERDTLTIGVRLKCFNNCTDHITLPYEAIESLYYNMKLLKLKGK